MVAFGRYQHMTGGIEIVVGKCGARGCPGPQRGAVWVLCVVHDTAETEVSSQSHGGVMSGTENLRVVDGDEEEVLPAGPFENGPEAERMNNLVGSWVVERMKAGAVMELRSPLNEAMDLGYG